MPTDTRTSRINEFIYYKQLGEKALAQVPDDKLDWQYNETCNSAATIVNHLWGNMLSRWTDFLTTDGEKTWRDRDAEFENTLHTRAEVMQRWHEGWTVLLDTLHSLTEDDLDKTIYIRHQGHTVREAIDRQLAHYPYHVGQLVMLGKMLTTNWVSLSIPKGASQQYNQDKFSQPPHPEHFTAEYLKPDQSDKTV
ncbi:DUF1572 family protein [Fibrella sp. HMF5335]|uniref:DUF1572 family protein n=1 Tax=Fibrella rubiginis TaxID=2817060 RepID=A0A939GEW0_9BACT|nr:DUF1572 family protein [Fibrella rubiginis]MBO0935520.1 DUF1572 family protein [Fibrella rubiginis]